MLLMFQKRRAAHQNLLRQLRVIPIARGRHQMIQRSLLRRVHCGGHQCGYRRQSDVALVHDRRYRYAAAPAAAGRALAARRVLIRQLLRLVRVLQQRRRRQRLRIRVVRSGTRRVVARTAAARSARYLGVQRRPMAQRPRPHLVRGRKVLLRVAPYTVGPRRKILVVLSNCRRHS